MKTVQRLETLQQNFLTLQEQTRNHSHPKPSRTRGKSRRNFNSGKQRIKERKRKEADPIRAQSSERTCGNKVFEHNAHKSKCVATFTEPTGRSLKTVHDTHSPADKQREEAIEKALEALLD